MRHARLFWDGLEVFGVDVEEGSLLWKLYDMVDQLPPGPWRPERVAWWLLTGDPPEEQLPSGDTLRGLADGHANGSRVDHGGGSRNTHKETKLKKVTAAGRL